MKFIFHFIILAYLLMLGACGQKLNPQQKNNQLETSKNKELMLLIVEKLFNQGDTTVADQYFVPDFAQEEKQFTKLIRGAFPDLLIKVDIQVAEGNLVAARWIATGTQKGKFLGVEPSHKTVTWKGSWFWTFEQGRVIAGMGQGSWDALGLLKQLQTK